MTESPGGERWRSLFDDLTHGAGRTEGEPATGETGASDRIIGTPEVDASTWDGEQGYSDTCAVRCQQFIIQQFTGEEVDEATLVAEAGANGWYEPGAGTDPKDVGKLLEAHGVSTTNYDNASSFDLANELAQGHKVIVGIDSGELGSEGLASSILEWLFDYGKEADHAVVVSGIDTTDPQNPQVIVSDPGTGEAAATYPFDQFLEAWRDSDFRMTATEEPAPSNLPEMSNFDYKTGHIPEVAGVPYDEFLGMRGEPEEFDELLRLVAQEERSYAPETPAETAYGDAPERGAAGEEGSTPQPLDPGVPEPAVDPQLLDPSLPGPTLSRDLFDPSAPGPTLDPGLLDPSAPGPTIDPALLDPYAPGPTLDPSLLDPAAPGPSIDAAVLDPSAPGPTLDPGLLDPSTPGTAVYPEWFVDTLAWAGQGIEENEMAAGGDWSEEFDAHSGDDASESGVW